MKIIKVKSCFGFCRYVLTIDYDTFLCKHPDYPYPKEKYSLRAYSDQVLEDCPLEEYKENTLR